MKIPSEAWEAYAMGVKHGTEALCTEASSGGYYKATEINERLLKRRKELLPPKRVTKWFNIYKNGYGVVPDYYSSGSFDTEADAIRASITGIGYVSTHSVEIEVPQ